MKMTSTFSDFCYVKLKGIVYILFWLDFSHSRSTSAADSTNNSENPETQVCSFIFQSSLMEVNACWIVLRLLVKNIVKVKSGIGNWRYKFQAFRYNLNVLAIWYGFKWHSLPGSFETFITQLIYFTAFQTDESLRSSIKQCYFFHVCFFIMKNVVWNV